MMERISATLVGCVGLLAMGVSCAEHRRPTLNTVEAQQCRIEGGYESRAPFGTPFCQFRYPDAGKSCTGKADCLGQCLSDAPDNAAAVSVGTAVAGHCAAEKETFGCHARVEVGRLAEPYSCVD
jgi:hypothetical protein